MSSVRSTCSASGGRQAHRQLLEGGGEVGVVLVGVADHEPGRQDDRHRLGLGQLQRRQERLVRVDAPQPALGPDRDADLLVDGAQVAVDGANGHADALREVARADPVGVGLEDGQEPGHPGQPVALGAVPARLVLDGHRAGG